jgi:carbon-monoxide dehydrogenase medium subunit
VVLGAVAPTPAVARPAAAILVGNPPADDVFEEAAAAAMRCAAPISDVRGSAEFRRELVGVLTRRALRRAGERARMSRQRE